MIVFFGKKYCNKITVKRGHHHDYLGMDLDYSHQGMVKMSTIKHTNKIFQDFPDEIRKSSANPASDHLFKIRDPEEMEKLGKYLSKDRAKSFHHTVAQCLFVGNKVRRDNQTTVAFLTTRVKSQEGY